jgi:predicted DNA-binding transcriptional regulator AlpA
MAGNHVRGREPVAGGPVLRSRYLTALDAAELLGVTASPVYQWRDQRSGPPIFHVGRHLRYAPDAVRAWIDSLTERAV